MHTHAYRVVRCEQGRSAGRRHRKCNESLPTQHRVKPTNTDNMMNIVFARRHRHRHSDRDMFSDSKGVSA